MVARGIQGRYFTLVTQTDLIYSLWRGIFLVCNNSSIYYKMGSVICIQWIQPYSDPQVILAFEKSQNVQACPNFTMDHSQYGTIPYGTVRYRKEPITVPYRYRTVRYRTVRYGIVKNLKNLPVRYRTVPVPYRS